MMHIPYYLLSIKLSKLATLSYELIKEFSACGVLKRQIIIMMRLEPFVEFDLTIISIKNNQIILMCTHNVAVI